MPQLHYLIGDATSPIHKPTINCHVCNDIGGWGRGYVLALSRINPLPEHSYRTWHKLKEFNSEPFGLGHVIFVPFTNGVTVANMIGQHGTEKENGVPPIRYDAVEACLNRVYQEAVVRNATVSAPRFGADLAGGEWSKIEEIIKKAMLVDTYIYTLDKERAKWPGAIYENDTQDVHAVPGGPDIDLNTVFK
jgi:O-acetyl-ADP-ribose deacetylase (regulator of RNase III)